MTAQDDDKHDEQEKDHARTGTSRWTADAIRALGAITDLQTLADIVRVQPVDVPQDGAHR